jgi:RNA polymerase sigma-32 factor
MSLQVENVQTRAGAAEQSSYLKEIREFPVLTPQQEFLLSKRWRELGNQDAADQLVTSHLRLVGKLARGYRGYGLPLSELISEGNIGLIRAVKRFEPDRGARFSTYAAWWIKAAMQEYILRSWSMVRMGTTAGQKKLFFNLRRAKRQICALDAGDLRPDQIRHIASRLGVAEREVVEMNQRLVGDVSLNAPNFKSDSGQWQDGLIDENADQETRLAENQENDYRREILKWALNGLNEREHRIFSARHLAEKPLPLEDLAKELDVSPERVRQLGQRAYEKVEKAARDRFAGQRRLSR